VVVNSTYETAANLHASVQVHGLKWNELYSAQATVDASLDSAQRVFTIPENLYAGPERLFLIDLTLSDSKGSVLSRNFYWVPGTLTSFDWPRTDYTHTPAARHEDLTALANLPPAQVQAAAEIQSGPGGSEINLHLKNTSATLAFQVHAAARTQSGGLIAPVFWSDNWIELTPGESAELKAQLPEGMSTTPIVQIEGWNVAPATVTPRTR
jgi:exo-1,4-beta-D-glucosaminidase